MIVGSIFDGDNDIALQWQQHDCYREALGIIAHGWRGHYSNAAIMLGQDTVALPERFDHRTLQAAHDFLAAWWRWKHNRHDPYFERLEPATVDDWLQWLRQEVAMWPAYMPHITRWVAQVLLNQNADVGYSAEDNLLQELKDNYKGMPEKSYDVEKSTRKQIDPCLVGKQKKPRILLENIREIGGSTNKLRKRLLCRMTLSDLKIPYLLVAGLSLIALAHLPYGYYMFLRIAVTACASMAAYLQYQAGNRNLLLWWCVAVAILFNPVLPIHLTREIWMVMNIIVACLFGYLFLKP